QTFGEEPLRHVCARLHAHIYYSAWYAPAMGGGFTNNSILSPERGQPGGFGPSAILAERYELNSEIGRGLPLSKCETISKQGTGGCHGLPACGAGASMVNT
ncbi:MAG TPA: hypothetical protein VFU37_19165, partial [Pyrinomonadaceae bacterium]|nr:hypothetical protein [Pyrinomonadaceae bacterium]